MEKAIKILTQNFGREDSHTLEAYTKTGGYQAVRKVLGKIAPEGVIEEVKRSNLRGLGGAGFPTGMKWSFISKPSKKPVYLLINGDEGEPGTFKDRTIMTRDPHRLIEGVLLASYALGAHTAYIYVRGEFTFCMEALGKAIAEAKEAGYLGKNILKSGFDLDVYIHPGAGAYICGEETALIESLEGKPGRPRNKPPFPAVVGAFGCPTIVNNVETIAHVPQILLNGAEWFAKIGSDRNGGTRLFSVSGHVKKPGVYELPMGTPLREILYEHAGGIIGDSPLKGVIPGGSSAPILRPEEIDVGMDFDQLAKIGSMGGSGGIIAMAEGTCMVWALHNLARFYAHESCGQCSPCREGTGWAEKVLRRIEGGHGTASDIELLEKIAKGMMTRTICPLADACALPILSYLKKYRDEFEAHVREKHCPVRPKRAA
jgi:NADH-quinone oxidoreductase subunit F